MTKNFPRAVVFDLDGTLADTAPDLTLALNWVLASVGRAAVDDLSVRHMVGQGAAHLIRQGMQATGAAATEEDLDHLLPRFLAFYSDHIADRSVLFPGVLDVLHTLTAEGIALAVCTNKPESLTHQLLRGLAVDHFFPVVVGGDSLPVRKPDPAHILATLHRLGVGAAEAVMVGDSVNDIRAAQGANVPVVGVTFGYTETPIEELGADLVIDRFAALPEALRHLAARARIL